MTAPSDWRATVRFVRPDRAAADRLASALQVESVREAPRSAVRVRRPGPEAVVLEVTARDTSAARATLNTYLSWAALVLATERAAGGSGASADGRDASRSR